ncbi:major capsid protein [Acinetobacter puyangensis]|uniref:major capsid protein n=1 Tax=Acinetobacter puyangensis TaxID=1096779 RepID=UPI003A4E3B8B
MPTIVQTNPTLADVAYNIGTNSKVGKIIEVLNQRQDLLDDAVVLEANSGTHNKTSVRTGLPKGTWRKLNYGVQPEKTARVQVTDSTGQLTTYSEIDKTLYDLQGSNAPQWRSEEDAGFVEGLSQEVMRNIIYGDTTGNVSTFNGLAIRYNNKIDPETGVAPANAANIIDAGGTGSNNTSIFIVQWDQTKTHLFYPQGTQAGLDIQDKGQVTLEDETGGRYEGLRTYFQWDVGLAVRDWRSVVRIANIDATLLKKDASTGANLIDLLDDALSLLPLAGSSRVAIYMNRTVNNALKGQTTYFKNVRLTLEDFRGDGKRKIPMYDGVPIRICDVILNTEARVV